MTRRSHLPVPDPDGRDRAPEIAPEMWRIARQQSRDLFKYLFTQSRPIDEVIAAAYLRGLVHGGLIERER